MSNTPVVGDVELFEWFGAKGAAIPASTLSITTLNRANGFVTVQAGPGGYFAGDFQAEYGQAQVDTVTVTIISDQDPVGLTLTATETGADTGEFTDTIIVDALTTTPLAATPGLWAPNTNQITARYKDTTPGTGTSDITVSTTANVETSEPTFSTLAPEDGFSTQSTFPIFTGIVNDSGAPV